MESNYRSQAAGHEGLGYLCLPCLFENHPTCQLSNGAMWSADTPGLSAIPPSNQQSETRAYTDIHPNSGERDLKPTRANSNSVEVAEIYEQDASFNNPTSWICSL